MLFSVPRFSITKPTIIEHSPTIRFTTNTVAYRTCVIQPQSVLRLRRRQAADFPFRDKQSEDLCRYGRYQTGSDTRQSAFKCSEIHSGRRQYPVVSFLSRRNRLSGYLCIGHRIGNPAAGHSLHLPTFFPIPPLRQ